MSHKCVSTFYIDYKFEHDRMIKSLLHFHPEVNIETLNKDEIRAMQAQGRFSVCYYPEIELHLFEKYSTVKHIDGDVIIVDKIDELFDDTTDARAGRNNSDNNKA